MRCFAVRLLVVVALAAVVVPIENGATTARAAFPGYSGLIAFARGLEDAEIWVMDAMGSNLTRLTDTAGTDTSSTQPTWSSDGTRIAFESNRSGDGEIYVMNADGSDQVRLTNTPGENEHHPAWSPDGSRIAYAKVAAGNIDIWVMDADGSDQVNLTNDPSMDTKPSWSPDGTKIAFASTREGNGDIFVMNVDGSGVANVTHSPTGEDYPDWSPDGSRIAFVRSLYPVDERAGLWVANSDGTNQRKVGGDQHSHMPSWSPDGTHLVFYDGYEYALFRIASGGTQKAVRLTSSHVEEYWPDWQPLSTPPPSVGDFTSLTPARILDTRDGTGRGGSTAPLGAGETIDVQITGLGGVALTGVAAVVLNATVTQPTEASFLTIWPTGIARPEISNLNYLPGQSVPNLVTVAVGQDGRVSVYNLAGSAHVIFDVVGFYAGPSGPSGSRFHAIDPYRYFDTRDGSGGVAAQPLGPNGILSFDVLGKGQVPPTGVTAVIMNVTVTQPTTPSYLTVYPGDIARPVASNLNYLPGQTVPNLVTVRVPSSGIVDFYNLAGNAHVVVDVVGYYDGDKITEAGRFIPLPPSRAVDTRQGGGAPLGPNDYAWLDMPGWNGVPATGAGAVVINTTVTQPTANSFLTVFPDDLCEYPLASNLNYVPRQTVPNLVVVRLSVASDCANAVGAIDFYNAYGFVHVIVDVFGYFTNELATVD